MYNEFYGFTDKPFNVTPDPRFLFLSQGHREALASLMYGIMERRGFIVMIGEVGTGKTTLINALCQRLDSRTSVACIFNTNLGFEDMLHQILEKFGLAGVDNPLPKVAALKRLERFALHHLDRGGNVAIIIDEAQNLGARSLENLRLLSNLETSRHKLLQIILSGQPELDKILNLHELRQFAQRISLKRYIKPLSRSEVNKYIDHHLNLVNYRKGPLFDNASLQLIWDYSKGVPRKINNLCDNALLIGFALESKKIKASIVQEAINDLSSNSPAAISNKNRQQSASTFAAAQPDVSKSWISSKMLTAAAILASLSLGAAGLSFWQTRTLQNMSGPSIHFPIQAPKTDTSPGRAAQPEPEQITGGIQSEGSFSGPPNRLVAPIPGPVRIDTQGKASAPDRLKTGQIEEIRPATSARHQNEVDQETMAPPKEPPRPALPREGVYQRIVVQEGDTLYVILTQKYGFYLPILPEVLKLNPEITDPDKIATGQVIKLPKLELFGEIPPFLWPLFLNEQYKRGHQ